jgi:hypothetical protein
LRVSSADTGLKFFKEVDFVEAFCHFFVFGVQREPYRRAEEGGHFLWESEARLRNKDGGSFAYCGGSFGCGRREQPQDSPDPWQD